MRISSAVSLALIALVWSTVTTASAELSAVEPSKSSNVSVIVERPPLHISSTAASRRLAQLEALDNTSLPLGAKLAIGLVPGLYICVGLVGGGWVIHRTGESYGYAGHEGEWAAFCGCLCWPCVPCAVCLICRNGDGLSEWLWRQNSRRRPRESCWARRFACARRELSCPVPCCCCTSQAGHYARGPVRWPSPSDNDNTTHWVGAASTEEQGVAALPAALCRRDPSSDEARREWLLRAPTADGGKSFNRKVARRWEGKDWCVRSTGHHVREFTFTHGKDAYRSYRDGHQLHTHTEDCDPLGGRPFRITLDANPKTGRIRMLKLYTNVETRGYGRTTSYGVEFVGQYTTRAIGKGAKKKKHSKKRPYVWGFWVIVGARHTWTDSFEMCLLKHRAEIFGPKEEAPVSSDSRRGSLSDSAALSSLSDDQSGSHHSKRSKHSRGKHVKATRASHERSHRGGASSTSSPAEMNLNVGVAVAMPLQFSLSISDSSSS